MQPQVDPKKTAQGGGSAEPSTPPLSVRGRQRLICAHFLGLLCHMTTDPCSPTAWGSEIGNGSHWVKPRCLRAGPSGGSRGELSVCLFQILTAPASLGSRPYVTPPSASIVTTPPLTLTSCLPPIKTLLLQGTHQDNPGPPLHLTMGHHAADHSDLCQGVQVCYHPWSQGIFTAAQGGRHFPVMKLELREGE